MSYLADACALVVFYGGGRAGHEMVEGMRIMTSEDVAVLPTTVWEISRKIALGRLEMPISSALSTLLHQSRFNLMPFTWEDAELAASLPDHHRDPMDRMVIAAALRANMTVISSDRIFAAYGVKTVW